MKIELRDIFEDETHEHEVEITTDHPCSSYGQPVVVFDDGDCLNAESWLLGSGQVIEASAEERDMFRRWLGLIELMAGGRHD